MHPRGCSSGLSPHSRLVPNLSALPPRPASAAGLISQFLEKKFLELIDYDVSISASLYASYYFQLRTLCQRVDREFTLKPMDAAAAATLEARGAAYKNKFAADHGASGRKHQSDNIINGGAPGSQQSSSSLCATSSRVACTRPDGPMRRPYTRTPCSSSTAPRAASS